MDLLRDDSARNDAGRSNGVGFLHRCSLLVRQRCETVDTRRDRLARSQSLGKAGRGLTSTRRASRF